MSSISTSISTLLSYVGYPKSSTSKKVNELETGDIILFRGNSWLSYVVEWFGKSPYSHVGIIIKNPSFMNCDLKDRIRMECLT